MVDCKERGVNAPLRLVGCPKGPNDAKQDIKGQGPKFVSLVAR